VLDQLWASNLWLIFDGFEHLVDWELECSEVFYRPVALNWIRGKDKECLLLPSGPLWSVIGNFMSRF